MLDNTVRVYKQTVKDLNKINFVANIVFQSCYIVYLLYAVISKLGLFYINLALLALAMTYLVYFIVSYNEEEKRKKKIRQRVKNCIKYAKYALQSVIILTSVYNLYVSNTQVVTVPFLFTLINIIVLFLQIIVNLLTNVIIDRYEQFVEAIHADLEPIEKTVKNLNDFKKSVTHGRDAAISAVKEVSHAAERAVDTVKEKNEEIARKVKRGIIKVKIKRRKREREKQRLNALRIPEKSESLEEIPENDV